MTDTIKIGTRRSKLATWQAEYVRDALAAAHPEHTFDLVFMTTEGDRILDKPLTEIGGKGLFTFELERALRAGEIDMAVHSLKDLPTDLEADFTVGAVPVRANPADVWVGRGGAPLDDLPAGATVGTSSLRRQAQLLKRRPDLKVQSIRGNVGTRLSKAHDPDGPYHGIILAAAGIERLGLHEHVTAEFPFDFMLPAPGQGAIGVQSRAADGRVNSLLAALEHNPTRLAVTAERTFLNVLEAGCRLPVAAYGAIADQTLHLSGRVGSLDGQTLIEVARSFDLGAAPAATHIALAEKLGRDAAREAIEAGAGELIAAVKEHITGDE
jgi:hydroxymethylbilane synthase